MSYKLFIDDIRHPPIISERSWQVVRTSEEAIQLVKTKGMPEFISFDHDLGGQDTTMKFLDWLQEELVQGKYRFPKGFSYHIHSMNPVGVSNLHGRMKALLRHFSE